MLEKIVFILKVGSTGHTNPPKNHRKFTDLTNLYLKDKKKSQKFREFTVTNIQAQ